MNQIRWSQTALILPVFLLACMQNPQTKAPPADPPPVASYLNATDSQKATHLLGQLLDYPITELLKVLTAPREYPTAPTGRLPSRAIQVNGTERRYGLYVPQDYQPDKAYPLIICLHGAGFNGDTYLDRWQPRLGERYLLACPSVEFGAWWTREAEELVLAVLRDVIQNYHVNLDRIFLTGMSNGGTGTYLIGLNHIDLFAALIPMAGVLPGPLLALLDNAQTTPLYLIHGAEDQVIPSEYSRAVQAYLLKRGYNVVYREHNRVHPLAGGHFFPREELPALMEWLEEQRKVSLPRTMTIIRDRDHPGRVHWIRIEDIDPEVGSFWASEKDPGETQRFKKGLYARIEARVGSDNQIEVTAQHVRRYTILLNSALVDFSRPVRILTNGELSFEGMVMPDPGVLLEEARRWSNPKNLVLAAIEVVVKP